MLKMTIDNEEVVSDKDIMINEEMLSASSSILNNVYPKEWEEDKDYTSRFYYPQDYSKALIQRSYVTQEAEAGTTIQVNGSVTLTDVDTTKNSRVLRLLGQTSQTGTPTPSSPIPVNVVSGDNGIRVQGKNLAYMKNGTYTYGNNTGVITDNSIFTLNSNGTGSNSYFSFANGYTREWAPESIIAGINDMHLTQDGGTYSVTITTNKTMSSAIAMYFWSSNNRKFNTRLEANTTKTMTIGLNAGEHIKDFGIWSPNTNIFTDYTIKVQLEKGSSSSTYEPYIGNTYNIDLPEGMELCKIGNYQDYIYKDSDKWYLHKEIGKYIFGSTNLAYDSTYNRAYTNVSSIINNILIPTSNSEALNGLSDYFSILNATTFLGNTSLNGLAISSTGTLSLRNTSYTTQTDYNNWLSTNKPILYYALATPTNTEITYAELLNQLNALSSQ